MQLTADSLVVGFQSGRSGADAGSGTAGSVSGPFWSSEGPGADAGSGTDCGGAGDSSLVRLQWRNGFFTAFHALLKNAWILLLLLPRVGIS